MVSTLHFRFLQELVSHGAISERRSGVASFHVAKSVSQEDWTVRFLWPVPRKLRKKKLPMFGNGEETCCGVPVHEQVTATETQEAAKGPSNAPKHWFPARGSFQVILRVLVKLPPSPNLHTDSANAHRLQEE